MATVFIGGTSIAGGLGPLRVLSSRLHYRARWKPGSLRTTISGYWVQLIEGLVMGASVVLNRQSSAKATVRPS